VCLLCFVRLGVSLHTEDAERQREDRQILEHDGGTVAHTNLGKHYLECRNNFDGIGEVLRPLEACIGLWIGATELVALPSLRCCLSPTWWPWSGYRERTPEKRTKRSAHSNSDFSWNRNCRSWIGVSDGIA
jgi:hypothetical protein